MGFFSKYLVCRNLISDNVKNLCYIVLKLFFRKRFGIYECLLYKELLWLLTNHKQVEKRLHQMEKMTEMEGSVVSPDLWMPKKMLVQEIIDRGNFFSCFLLRDIIEIKGNSLPPHNYVHQ